MRLYLRPDWVFQDYTDVTAAFLAGKGVKLLLADLDYTLAPKSVLDPDETVLAWLKALEDAGITVVIISNNRNSDRVKRFCAGLGIEYIGRAQKPYRHSYLEAMARYNVTARQTMALGDKLLTDTIGAKRCAIDVMLVEPKGGAITPWQKVLHALQEPFKRLSAHDERKPAK